MVDKPVFCVNCVYHEQDPLQRSHTCVAPFPGHVDLVTGEAKSTIGCKFARELPYLCGPDGLYYEKREQEKKMAQEPKPQGRVKVIAGRGDREVK